MAERATRVGEHLYRVMGGYRADVQAWADGRDYQYETFISSADVDAAMATACRAALKDHKTPRAPVRMAMQVKATQGVFFIRFFHYEASRDFAQHFTDVQNLRPSVDMGPRPDDIR